MMVRIYTSKETYIEVDGFIFGNCSYISVPHLYAILCNNKSLSDAFTWSRTPQGAEFWSIQQSRSLSNEGRDILLELYNKCINALAERGIRWNAEAAYEVAVKMEDNREYYRIITGGE